MSKEKKKTEAGFVPDGITTFPYSATDIDEKLSFKTSANVLCNFMKEFGYLKAIIKDMAIKPRYVEERIDYLGIPDRTSIAFPMTCFCDIPLAKINSHTEEYGKFGIALNKNYCIKKDVQPILYLNKNSRLKGEFSDCFKRLFESSNLQEEFRYLPNTLLDILLYSKPIDGEKTYSNQETKHYLFKDECEWRYIPSDLGTMPLILEPEQCTEKGRFVFSSALSKKKKTWFRFETKDVEFIIVPDENHALKMISEIRMMRKSARDKDLLISKIDISEKLFSNF